MSKGRVVITEDGQIQVFIDEGEFDQAAKEVDAIFKLLQAEGIEFDKIGVVEQHRHDHDHAHNHHHDHH